MTQIFTPRPAFAASDDSASGSFAMPDTASNSGSPTNYSSEIARRPVEIPSSSSGYGLSQPTDSTLTVGRNIQLTGQISTCDKLIVEGYIEAELDSCREIDVTATGTFKGSAEIETATISGIFEGSLTVRHRLTVKKGARIDGTVQYREMEVEPGAIITGTVSLFES